MDSTSAAKRITVEYEDGSIKELDKGLVFSFEDEIEETAHIVAELVNMAGRDLYTVVSAAMELGAKLGTFGDREDAEDEE